MRPGLACMLCLTSSGKRVENRLSSSPSLLQTCQRQIRPRRDLSGSHLLPSEYKDAYYRTDSFCSAPAHQSVRQYRCSRKSVSPGGLKCVSLFSWVCLGIWSAVEKSIISVVALVCGSTRKMVKRGECLPSSGSIISHLWSGLFLRMVSSVRVVLVIDECARIG